MPATREDVVIRAAFSEAEFTTIIRALELSEHVAAGLRDERRTFALPLLRGRCQAMLDQARAER